MTDAAGDLVFSGEDDGNPFGLLDMNEPARQARITYADDSPDVSGSLAIQAVWQQAVLTAVVDLQGTSQADLEAKKARLQAVIGRLSYTAIQEINGVQTTLACYFGSMVPASDSIDLNELEEFSASYTLSIPCQPLGA